MGANIVRRLVDAGHEAVVYDHSPDAVKARAREAELRVKKLEAELHAAPSAPKSEQ